MESPAAPSPDHDDPALRRRLRLLALAVAAWAVAVHANTLWNGLVYDDIPQVVENRWLRDVGNIPRIFTTGAWDFQGEAVSYYRPVMHVTYLLTYQAFGLEPWAFHAVNVVLHAAASVLVFLLAFSWMRRAVASPRDRALPALAAGLLFAANPVATEAAAWVACIPELTYSVLYLLALLLYDRAPRMRSVAFVGSVAAFAGALLSKEPAITLPAVLVASDVALRREPGGLRAGASRLAPFLGVAAVYLALRLAVLPARGSIGRDRGLTVAQEILNVPVLFARYLAKLLLPSSLNVYHMHPAVRSLASPEALGSIVACLAFVALTVLAWRRRSPALPALALLAVPVTPVLFVRLIAGENVFAERFAYLSTAGVALLAGLGIAWAARRRPSWATGLRLAFALLLVVLAAATVRRNRVWRSDETLWADALAQAPESGGAHHELGVALLRRGADAEAAPHLEEAVRLRPDMELAHYNLARLRERQGRLDEAVEGHRRAVSLAPDLVEAWNDLGELYRRRGQAELAAQSFLAALGQRPGALIPRLNLAQLYRDTGLRDAAMDQYQVALRLHPEDADAHLAAGTAYGEAGNLPLALDHLRTAARLAPRDPIVRRNLSLALRLSGRAAEADAEQRQAEAIERSPAQP